MQSPSTERSRMLVLPISFNFASDDCRGWGDSTAPLPPPLEREGERGREKEKERERERMIFSQSQIISRALSGHQRSVEEAEK